MKVNIVVFCCSLLVSITFSCQPQKESTFSIGFSQCVSDDQWRMSMHREMQRELLFYPELKLEIKDAGGSNETQIKHIREFIDQGVDLLIVSPNEADPVTPMVEQAIEKGIPVITIDRKISSNVYTAFVGANNFEIGEIAGQYAANILSKGDKVIELWGLKGSSPSIGRGEGFGKFIDPDDYTVVNIYTDWSRPDAERKLSEIIGDHLDVDLIFAHNDRMALGAYQICKNLGIAEEVKFIGIDGLPGNTGGMQAIQDGILDATLLYPT
ncbi:MAG: substrate-binding domain-containing protein, partial [Cyclobacteriaceae bacterium]